ncbi:DNA methyltransferase [Paraliomyxa miuraensis]|uniref:DNA methyltransferase n=1 Tax=Paraliomyxa miuraensis TaxID=376150 RepID=UPI0022542242|nr:DNA methyltransferase [Paraliomyxa miuraensis]MCX4247585.1 site-specific DNA-methyltransferase [Paraliomyxa miuraensis]
MPTRTVHHGDGVQWLHRAELGPEHALVTSLPDVSELPALGLPAWRTWFLETATLVCSRVDPRAVAVFYQTDIKHDGRWIDKASLVQRAAEDAGLSCLWHKIVCRVAPGHTTFGRPAYGHWLAFSKELRLPASASTPDVLPLLGGMTWARAMPMSAAAATCRFLVEHTTCRVVVDPFCGHGTILAVANAQGLDGIGVELSSKRVRKAQRLVLDA